MLVNGSDAEINLGFNNNPSNYYIEIEVWAIVKQSCIAKHLHGIDVTLAFIYNVVYKLYGCK